MYKYEFVKIGLKTGFLTRKPRENYHEIIKEYAEKGWKFKQIFAPAVNGHGASGYFELIFEKKV